MYKTPLLGILLLCSTFIRCTGKQMPFDIIGESAQCTIVLNLGNYANAESADAASSKVDWFDKNTDDDAVCTQALAALELRRYLAKITGRSEANIPIIDDDAPVQGTLLFLGLPGTNSAYTDLGKKIVRRWKKVKSHNREGFRLDTFSGEIQNILVLSGRTPAGTLYAVYELLDRLGVRWYGPQNGDESVPSRKKITIPPLTQYIEPGMEIRGFRSEQDQCKGYDALADAADSRANLDFVRWMGRNRLNYLWQQESDIPALKQRGIQLYCGGPGEYVGLLDPSAPYPYNYPNFQGDENKPADPYKSSQEYWGDTDHDNVLSYSEAHPEWYGLTKDKTRSFPKDNSGTNFCSSNSDGLAELGKNILLRLENGIWNHSEVYDFWPLTGAIWCQCPGCQALGNDTDKMLHVLYEIRRTLKGAFEKKQLSRDVRVTGPAYGLTLLPPEKSLPKDFDYSGIAIFMHMVDRCSNHSLFDTTCIEINVPLCQNIGNWFSKKCPYKGKIYLCEYYNSSRFNGLPLVFSTIIRLDLPRYEKLGIHGLAYVRPRTEHLAAQTLLNYQFAHKTWDPMNSMDDLVSDYFAHHYAGVSDLMRDYYLKMEEVFANVKAWRYELADRINLVARDSLRVPLLPLVKYRRHFNLEEKFSEQNDGVDWERSYQLIHDARHVIDEALAGDLPDATFNRLLEDEYQLRFGEMTIQLYDQAIRLLTLSEDEPEMREEAVIRLREAAKNLAQYEIRSPACRVRNGLKATGIDQAVENLLASYGQERARTFRRIYDQE
jgi:hypothetical protein